MLKLQIVLSGTVVRCPLKTIIAGNTENVIYVLPPPDIGRPFRLGRESVSRILDAFQAQGSRLFPVPDYGVIRILENRGIGVGVDSTNHFGTMHPHYMQNRAGNTESKGELRMNRIPCLSDGIPPRREPCIDRSTRYTGHTGERLNVRTLFQGSDTEFNGYGEVRTGDDFLTEHRAVCR